MFIEDGVEVVVIRTWIPLQVRREAGVGVVDALCVIVALPELDRADVGGDEDG